MSANGTPQDVLPLAISVPHGGTKCPPELADRIAISERDLFEDGDAFTREIYSLQGVVARYVSADIARAFVDLNRAEGDLPPANPDGVVKSHSDHGVPVYRDGADPDCALTELLLERYHRPYHRQLSEFSNDPAVVLALDCHSMESHAPPVSPDGAGTPRPRFCLSNADGKTCPNAHLEAMREILADAFEIAASDIHLNEPFNGGYIVRHHAAAGSVPWMQIEMNRSFYLADPWFDETTLTLREGRSQELSGRLERVLRLLVERL